MAMFPDAYYLMHVARGSNEPRPAGVPDRGGRTGRRGRRWRSDDDPTFTEEQVRRYARHIILPGIGGEGQRKLLDAKVLCIGAGGLGSPVAMYRAAAGVGTLGIVDFDKVDESNLQRQIVHSTADIGRPKVESAVDRLRAINPTIEIVPYDTILVVAERVRGPRTLGRRGGRDRQLPGAVPRQRRYAVPRQAARLRLDLPVRRPGHGVHARAGRARATDACSRSRRRPGPVPSCAEGGVFGALPGSWARSRRPRPSS